MYYIKLKSDDLQVIKDHAAAALVFLEPECIESDRVTFTLK